MESTNKKPLSDAQRRARKKYEAKTYKVAACKIRKEDYEKLDAYAKAHKKTVSSILAEFINSCIAE